jgi:hypothetical protein
MKIRRILGILALSISALCIGTIMISWISNLALDTTLEQTSELSEEEQIVLLETENLVDGFGNEVLPGFGEAEIPTILYNSEYAFLIGTTDPADGWVKIPQNINRGERWVVVDNEALLNPPYYRQPLPDPDITPEAFTVRVGEQWAASMQTYEWMRISLVEVIRADLPDFAKPIFPYKLFINQLVSGQDQYITLIVHERFHAYQGILAERKLTKAEVTNLEQQDNYPWADEALETAWRAELALLVEALEEENPEQQAALVNEFLAMRNDRRNNANLNNDLISYEQQREWLEGLARYAELKIWELAASPNYTPLPETSELTDFDSYQNFDARWRAELNQFSQMADDEGDGRFYYSGMAQAYLLDELMPDWKERILGEGIWLEDLLAEVIQN